MRRVTIAGVLAVLLPLAPAPASTCSIDRLVKQIVAEEYGKAAGQVSAGDKFAVDGPNTIEDADIHQMTEEKFAIKIPDAEWGRLVSVADIASYVQAHSMKCQG